MAVDTKQKRFSIMSLRSGVAGLPIFETDGAVDADDRQHLLGAYSGIAFDTGAVGGSISLLNWWAIGLGGIPAAGGTILPQVVAAYRRING